MGRNLTEWACATVLCAHPHGVALGGVVGRVCIRLTSDHAYSGVALVCALEVSGAPSVECRGRYIGSFRATKQSIECFFVYKT